MFDWVRFLDRHGIEYVTSGHNARRHVAAIQCPWCGNSDPSHHLGISTRGRGYNCWRVVGHSGKSPQRLIVALLGCSYEQAKTIVEAEDVALGLSDETFADEMMRGLGMNKQSIQQRATNTHLDFLPEFHQIEYRSGLCRMFVFPYLKKRGYSIDDTQEITERFDLHYATKGKFSNRVIVPVFMKDRLVTWTGRSFYDNDQLRYKTLPVDAEKAAAEDLPRALVNIKHSIFDYDNVMRGGKKLVVTEGPFDAMRVTFLGERYGIRGTALFSKRADPLQISLLLEAGERYEERCILVDREASLEAFMVLPDNLGVKALYLPSSVEDPAELTNREFRQLFDIS